MRTTLARPASSLVRKYKRYPQLRYYSAPGEGLIPESKLKYIPKTGSYPKGFIAGSAHVGVKVSNTSRHDLAIIASSQIATGAAVFTKNKFQAAPVTVTREIIEARNGNGIRGVVVNSGCANAVTGKGGIEDAYAMSKETDKYFHTQQNNDEQYPSTLVMSTGVIGQRLPIAKISSKIPEACKAGGSSHDHWLSVARAICTTDTFPKLLSHSFNLPSNPSITYSLAGMTKGAGMIHPNMATLLGIFCTDAPISPVALKTLLSVAVEKSFNSISIDGDMSTNDTVALLANGAAGGREIQYTGTLDSAQSEDFVAFQSILTRFATDLAKLVVRDGEGATKFITVRVLGSPSYVAAKQIASTISRSPLVKTALYGRDANWGRVLCAAGYSLVDSGHDYQSVVIPEQTSVSFVSADKSEVLKLLVNGEPENLDEERAARMLENEDLEILVRLRSDGSKGEEAVYWTCDLSHEYVTINGDYRT